MNPQAVLKYFLACLCLLAGSVYSHSQVVVNIQVDAQHPGRAIPADFLGLSYEMQRVLAETNGYHYFSADNQQLIATFKQLGIKNLRVGGNTADRPTLPVPSEADVDNLFAFAKAADVKVIYTLRLNQGNLDGAVALANYITRHYADNLNCFAIGNEPNVFSTNYDFYLAEWQRYAKAITAPSNCPNAKFSGPGVSPGHEKWSARFAGEPGNRGLLAFISQHDYPGGDARSVKDPALARDKIVSPAMATHYAKFAANFVPAILSRGIAYRFEEANSYYDGGAQDVSDTYASTLWALDYQWWWLTHGMSGINFHTGDKVAARDMNKPCRYASFWTVTNGYNVHPIAYAEKMFSLGGHGQLLPVMISYDATNLNLAVYAALGGDKNVYVTIINKSHSSTATNLEVTLGQRAAEYTKAEAIKLVAPDGDVSAKTGVTLGGAAITDDAKWDGTWQTLTLPSKASWSLFTVELPPASAAVVKLTPQ